MSKCIGCGIKLQNTDKDSLGYTNNLSNKYCERCFKTIHYNEERKINNLDNYKIIDKINKLSYFTVFITDLLNINEELINIYKSINNKKVLVINKCDIIPNTLKLEHLEDNIKYVYNIKEDVFFISAKKKYNLNRITNIIEDNINVIFCGETSSGKSTLINSITNSSLTTSKYDNTTLDFIKINYEDNNIYDSPGIFLSKKEVSDKILLNTKQLNDNFILAINDIKLKCNSNVTLFISQKCKINSKKESIKLDKIYNIEDNSDIVFPSLGFIYFKKGTKLESNKELEIRKSIIGK